MSVQGAVGRLELRTGPPDREPASFRDAMARFPSGVTIVTTRDRSGRRWGFTATSFCSVSMDPELVLVCLSAHAECFPVFTAADHWLVHVISPESAALAHKFATRGADKFADGGFTDDDRGLPMLEGASVVLDCSTHNRHVEGDHMVLIGRVQHVSVGPEEPVVYFERQFRELA
jgi:flavin reductase ActVB